MESWRKKILEEGFSKVPKEVQELTESKIKSCQVEIESLELSKLNFIRLDGGSL